MYSGWEAERQLSWDLQCYVSMTKADLVEEVSRVVEITRKEADVVVETILGSVGKALRDSDGVEIRSFGSFRTRQRAGRLGRNPKTGESVQVPPKTIAYFKPSKEVLESINTESSELGFIARPDNP